MNNITAKAPPTDQAQRERALNPAESILVQAPAGSGKTDLLTRRFLCLLAEVDDPGQILAITFTKAAAAEMRHRVLSKLEEASAQSKCESVDPFSMEALARRALLRSQSLGWNLLEQPARLRISTIDSFCRELALQRPLLSGLGDALDISEHSRELYRRAARRTLEQLDSANPALRSAIEELLLWHDNDWQQMEKLLVEMLEKRDRWMHGFVLDRDPDWDALRRRLERPFLRAVRDVLCHLSQLLDQVPEAREQALDLARFACEEPGEKSPWLLAACPEIPTSSPSELESAREVFEALADFLQTQKGTWRSEKGLKSADGFPSTLRGKAAKARFSSLINALRTVPSLESALAAVRELPPARYSEEDWQILRACFTLLRHAAAELQVAFAESGKVDYVEVAQIAQSVLKDPDGLPSDAAIAIADNIRHILVDEFQDTSRRQHELLRRLVAAWPDREGRSCFVVGDPMQSIYFFRDADAELFPRVKIGGLEIPENETLLFESVSLTANFRTARPLVDRLNQLFKAAFAETDGSGIEFAEAEPVRDDEESPGIFFQFHIKFLPKLTQKEMDIENEADENGPLSAGQIEEIISLVRSHLPRIEQACIGGRKYRIAVLARTHVVLAAVAEALREAAIPFRAVDLEKLSSRPEVLDVISLAHALLNPLDRVAWLGVLRAPWCGLTLSDLHILTSADSPDLLARPVTELLSERHMLLSHEGRSAVARLLEVVPVAPALRFAQPSATLGTWLRDIWLQLGGTHCADAAALANLDFLWHALDSLPNGEPDLLGPTLSAVLGDLTAQPDPSASSDHGVQLMTIHKSKGLEFEVVIVPDLQAGTQKGNHNLLSWLERGLPPEEVTENIDGLQEVTEFLVAPLQPKGTDRGRAKAWVDRVYQKRESQEMRRLLYVAATRAREELHLFAQPACRQNKNGEWELVEPKGNLLATAWPALGPEIRERFEQYCAEMRRQDESEPESTVIDTIAAEGQSNVLQMPALSKPNRLRRLPLDYLTELAVNPALTSQPIIGLSADTLYKRHEGGLLSRALGVAVHSLLEDLARLRQSRNWDAARDALRNLTPKITAQIRASGIAPQQAAKVAAEAFGIASRATFDLTGQWILSPHAEAESEVRWVGVVAGGLRTVQVDRIFRAGLEPRSDSGNVWWIIDYKTAHADALNSDAGLRQLREIFAPQLAAYADVLRKLRGRDTQIRAGLYYPRTQQFDWWEL